MLQKTIKRKTLLPVYLKGLVSGKYTLKQASESTGYCIDHLCRLKKRYKTEGLNCLNSKRVYGTSPNKTSEEIINKIVLLYSKEEYADLDFKTFTECLSDYENIKIHYQTLRRIMNDFGIKSPKSRKIKKKDKTHPTRPRRECEGDLWQIDGTPFAWFYKFGNMNRYCISAGVDDATSKITAAYMTENECVYGYNELLRLTINKYGIPREVYSDRAGIFCVTPKNKKNLSKWEELEGLHEKRTQWQRILEQLCMNQILAWTPQAKGRVERMWQTLQAKLPIAFYKHGIDTIEKANAFLPKYIEKYNRMYGVTPKDDDSFYIDCHENLDDILNVQIPRQTYLNGEFSFYGYKWIIKDCDRVSHIKFTLCISEKGIYAKVNDLYYNVSLLSEIQDEINDKMPNVLKDIIYRYMYADAKIISA